MNEYIFYTHEGITYSPEGNNLVENCQLLGRAQAFSVDEAKKVLYRDNSWIQKAGFTIGECFQDQVITNQQREDIKAVVDYLWAELASAPQMGNTYPLHIFLALSRLNEMISENS